MQDLFCACCHCVLTGTQWTSSLYGSDGILLCEDCGEAEEKEIERKGTNDIPALLTHYRTLPLLH